MNVQLLTLLICFTGLTFAGPISEKNLSNKCAQECNKKELSKFAYKLGKSYLYKYDTSTSLFENDKSTQVNIKCQVIITPLDDCDYSLKLAEVKINGVPDHESLEKALMKEQLKFSFNDGNITHICHADEEPIWVLNFKKAVLSSFQVTLDQFGGYRIVNEHDLFGECETQYNSISKSFAEGTQIKKKKNLLTCKNYINSKFAPIIYQLFINESKPLFECDLVVGVDSILKSVYCEESLKSPAKFLVNINKMSKISLTLDSVKDSMVADNLKEFKISSMLFMKESKKAKTFDQVNEIALKLCKEVENSIQAKATENIFKLTHSIKDLSFVELGKIWNKISEEKECKSKRIKTIFVNAVVNSRSHSSLEFMIKKLKPEKLISDRAYDYALWSLVMANKPCPYMVKAITPLFKNLSSQQALFGMTSMIQNHIETFPNVSFDAVENAINELISTIDKKKPAEAVLKIRALGNIHHITFSATEKLLNYAKDVSAPVEVRVAALDSLKNMNSPNDQTQKVTENLIYNQKDAPIEVRVAAYKLYVSKNHPLKVWKVVSEDKNDTNFASFIKSHLFNAKRSINQDKIKLRQDLFHTKIPMIKLSDGLSLNVELSSMKNDRSIGLITEIDWIVKSGHLTPSWVVANISLPFSKNMLNLLEIGILPKEGVKFESLMNIKEINLNSLKKLFTLKPKLIDSIYIKWLGKTLFYYNSQQEAGKEKAQSSILYFFENSPLLYLFEAGYSHIFYDRVFSYPTLNGLMTELSTRTILLKGLKVKSDTQQNGDQKKSVFKLYQNMFIDHERKMAVYVGGRSSKVKGDVSSKFLITTNFSITGEAEGNDKKVTITFNLGDEPFHFFTIQSNKHLHHFKGEKEEIMMNFKPKKYCSTSYTDKPLGFEICAQTEMSDSLKTFISKGYKMQLIFKKTDPLIKGYKLMGDVEKTDKKISAKFEFDASGSSLDRKNTLDFNFEGDRDWKIKMNKKLTFNIKSPSYKFDGNLSLNTQEFGESTIDVEFTINDNNRRSIEVIVDRKKMENGIIDIKSNWKINSPKLNEPLDLDAIFYFNKHNQLKTEVSSKKNGVSKNVFKFNFNKEGNLKLLSSRTKRSDSKDNLKVTLDVQVNEQTQDKWLNLKSKLEKNKTFKLETIVDYKKPGSNKQQMEFKTNFENESSTDDTKLETEIELKSTEYPKYNFKLDGKYYRKPKKELESSINFRWGVKKDGDKKKLYVLNKYKIENYEVGKNLKGKGTIKVTYGPENFDHQVDYNVMTENYPSKIEISMDHKNLNLPNEIRKAVYRRSSDINDPYLTSFYANYQYPKGEFHFNQETSKLGNNHYKKNALYKFTSSDGKASGYNLRSELYNDPKKKSHSMKLTTFPEEKEILKSYQNFEKEDKKFKVNSRVSYKGKKIYSANYSMENDNAFDGSAEVRVMQYDLMTRLAKKASKDYRLAIGFADNKYELKHKMDITCSPDKKRFKSETLVKGQNLATVETICENETKLIYLKRKNDWSIFWSQKKDENMILRQLNISYTDKNTNLDFKSRRWNKPNTKITNLKDIEKAVIELDYNNIPSNRKIKLSSKLEPKYFRLNYDHQKDKKLIALVDGKLQKDKQSVIQLETSKIKSFFEFVHENNAKQIKFNVNSKTSEHKYEFAGICYRDSNTTGRAEVKAELFIPPNNSFKALHKSSWKWEGDNVKFEVNTKRTIKTSDYDFILENIGNGTFSKNITTGPHTFTLKSFKNDKEIAKGDLKYKNINGVMNGDLKVTGEGKKYIDAQLESKVEGDLGSNLEKSSFSGTVKIDSDYSKLKDILYIINYSKEPKQRKLRIIRQKFGNITHDMDYITTKSDKKCHKQLKINFLNSNKSKGILNIDYEYSNKLKLNASLKELVSNSDNVISEVKIDVPLVSISKFIGNHGQLSLNLPIKGSKIYAEYTAPTINDIKLETGLIIEQVPYFFYQMNISEAEHEKNKVKRSLKNSTLLMKNTLTIKDHPKLIESNIDFSDNKIVYEARTTPAIIKLSYDKTNAEADKMFAQLCFKEDNSKKRCSTVEIKKVKKEVGREYDINTQFDRADGSVNKLLIQTFCHKDEKSHHFKMISTYNGRRFGQECLKTLTDNGKSVMVKLYLPERTLKTKLQYSNSTQSDSEIKNLELNVWLDAERKKDQKLTFKRMKKTIIDTKDSKHWNSQIEIIHPVWTDPLKIDTTYNMASKSNEKSRSLETKLQYSKETEKALNFKGILTTTINDTLQNINYNFRVFQEDSTIDFGCKDEWTTKDMSDKLNAFRNASCFWVDRNGTKQTMKKFESASKSKTSKYVSFIADYDNILFNFHAAGDVHLINEHQATSSFDLYLENDEKLRTKMSFNKTCILMDSSRVPDNKNVTNFDFGLCVLPTTTFNDILFKVYAIEKQMMENKYNLSNKFLLEILRVKYHPNDYLVSIKWDPEILGTVLVNIADELDKKRETFAVMLKQINEEIEHKIKILEDGLIKQVISPMAEHISAEKENLMKEMRPEIDHLKNMIHLKNERSKRSLKPSEVDPTVKEMEDLLDIKFIVYNPEAGEIEFIVKNFKSFAAFKRWSNIVRKLYK